MRLVDREVAWRLVIAAIESALDHKVRTVESLSIIDATACSARNVVARNRCCVATQLHGDRSLWYCDDERRHAALSAIYAENSCTKIPNVKGLAQSKILKCTRGDG